MHKMLGNNAAAARHNGKKVPSHPMTERIGDIPAQPSAIAAPHNTFPLPSGPMKPVHGNILPVTDAMSVRVCEKLVGYHREMVGAPRIQVGDDAMPEASDASTVVNMHKMEPHTRRAEVAAPRYSGAAGSDSRAAP